MVALDGHLFSPSGRVARWSWALAGLAVVVQTTAHLVNELMLQGRYPQLSAAVDSNAFGRANTLAIALSALLNAAGAFSRGGIDPRRIVLAASLSFLAVDDATGLHDRMRALSEPLEAAATVGFAGVLVLVFLLLAAEARRMRFPVRRLMIVGLLALAVGVALRMVGLYVPVDQWLGPTTMAAGVAVEQGLGLGGWILVALGLLAALVERAQPSSPPPHCPALTATLDGKAASASITAPTFPDGAAKRSRPSR
jgi:hypothetical protein